MSDAASDSQAVPQPVNVRDGDIVHHDEAHATQITVHLWSTWLGVGVGQVEEARQAREEMTRLRGEGKNFAVQLGQEFQASVVAVAAAANALDALYGSTVIPESARKKRQDRGSRRPSRSGSIREALKQAFHTGQVNDAWVTDFEWLFDLRNAVVHAGEKPAAPVPHPAGGTSAPEYARYSVESAERAVGFALSVFRRCVDHPRREAESWASIMRPNVELLERRCSWP